MKDLENTVRKILSEAKNIGKTGAENDAVIELNSINTQIQSVGYFLGSKREYFVAAFVGDRGGKGGAWVKQSTADLDISEEKKIIADIVLKAATEFDKIVAKEMKARGYKLR